MKDAYRELELARAYDVWSEVSGKEPLKRLDKIREFFKSEEETHGNIEVSYIEGDQDEG